MTLAPVFRSPAAVAALHDEGLWAQLQPDLVPQLGATRAIERDLQEVLGARYVDADALHTAEPSLAYLQRSFFLVLFRSVFRAMGVPPSRLALYAELNVCIQGTITAADNLFDDQDKRALPLRNTPGARFTSILQLMCFERLTRRALDRAQAAGVLDAWELAQVQRVLLDRMAFIGELEGSEEGGVRGVMPPERMLERVHRVRGGALFALAFAAPSVLDRAAPWRPQAEAAITQLGTAFQIVDDLTDVEADLARGSHNLLIAEVHHHGTAAEQAALTQARAGAPLPSVEEAFGRSARRVLARAVSEATEALTQLEALGFWLPPRLAPLIVRSIVGLDGAERVEALAQPHAHAALRA